MSTANQLGSDFVGYWAASQIILSEGPIEAHNQKELYNFRRTGGKLKMMQYYSIHVPGSSKYQQGFCGIGEPLVGERSDHLRRSIYHLACHMLAKR
jgi:hypothetical protein